MTGRNLRLVQETSNLESWKTGYGRLKKALTTAKVLEVDRWRLPYFYFLLAQRREDHNMVMEGEEDRLEELINILVMH